MDQFVFSLQLTCEDKNTTAEKDLVFSSLPVNTLEIKRKIETEFSIPVCVQGVIWPSLYGSLDDLDDLSLHHIRSGDTIKVAYLERGDCSDVIDTQKWLKELVRVLLLINQSISVCPDGDFMISRSTHDLYRTLITGNEANGILGNISSNLFSPWTDKIKYVNKLHFDSIGGLKLLLTVYGLVVKLRIDNISLEKLDVLECCCSYSVVAYTQTFPLCRRIVQMGGLEHCIKTLLWVKPPSSISIYSSPIIKAVSMSIYTISNISEISDYQFLLSQKSDLITQFFDIAKSVVFSQSSTSVIINFFSSLSQCTETHEQLMKMEVVTHLVEICEIRRKEQNVPCSSVIKVYSSCVIAQIVLASPVLIEALPITSLEVVNALLKRVSQYDPLTIRAYEEEKGISSATIFPHLKFLYSPSVNYDCEILDGDISKRSLLLSLNALSYKVLLNMLYSLLGRIDHVRILVSEGLSDFIVILPWHVPKTSRLHAQLLVKEVRKFVSLQPPTLSSLAKAKLAKMSWGLVKMLEIQSVNDLVSLYR